MPIEGRRDLRAEANSSIEQGDYPNALNLYLEMFHEEDEPIMSYYIILLMLRENQLENIEYFIEEGIDYTQGATRFLILQEVYEAYETADPTTFDSLRDDLIEASDESDHPLINDVLNYIIANRKDEMIDDLLEED